MKPSTLQVSLALTLVFLPSFLLGITPDSLYRCYQFAMVQEEGYKHLNILAMENKREYPDSSLRYAQVALEIAKESDDILEQVKALNTIGNTNRYLGNYEAALNSSFEALRIKKQATGEGSINAYMNIAIVYKQKGRYDFALEYYDLARERAIKKGSKRSLGSVLNNIANVYRQLGDFESALYYHRQCLDIRIQQSDTLGISFCYNNLGNLFMDLKNIKMALIYYKNAFSLKEKINNTSTIGSAYLNLGNAFFMAGIRDSAMLYLRKAEKDFLKTKNYSSLAFTYAALGNALIQSGDIEQGEKHLLQSLKMGKTKEICKEVITACNHLGNLYLDQGEADKAIGFFDMALKTAQKSGTKLEIAHGYENLSKVQQSLGNYQDGYTFLTLSNKIKDSIPDVQGENLIKDLYTKHKLESTEKEMAIMKKDKDIFVFKSMAGLATGLLILFGCIALLFRNRYRYQAEMNHFLFSRQKDTEEKNRRLAINNLELEQYTYAVSHDLKQPLRTIGSFASLLERRYNGQLGNEGREFIEYITNGVNQMDNMLSGMLNYAQIEKHIHSRENIDLNHLIAEIIDDLTGFIRHHDATIEVEFLPTIYGNRIGMSLILSNLIQNAIKFSDSFPKKATLGFKEEKENYVLSIKDNGIGIDPQYADKIFVLFQRLHIHGIYEGSGVGLAICKKVAHLHGGNISLESKPGEGSTFFVSLPK